MIGKVKKWLGIEGVKIELRIADNFAPKSGNIEGELVFTSMNDQMVNGFKLTLVEKYYRGRRKNKLVDEYKLGEAYIEEEFEVKAGEEIIKSFQLKFKVVHSDMDEWEKKFFLLRPFVKTAKMLKGVRSEYRVEAEADVQGTKLDPFVQQVIKPK